MSETGGSLDGTLLNELYTRYDPDAIQASFSPVPEAQEERLFTPGLSQAPIETLAPVRNLTPRPAPASEKLYSSAFDRASQALYTPPMETPEQLYSDYEPDDLSGIDNVYIATYRKPVTNLGGVLSYDRYPEGFSEPWLSKDAEFYRLLPGLKGESNADRVKRSFAAESIAGHAGVEMLTNRRLEVWGHNLTPELDSPWEIDSPEHAGFVTQNSMGAMAGNELLAWGTDPDKYHELMLELSGYYEELNPIDPPIRQDPRAPSVAASPTTALAPPTTLSTPRVVTPEAAETESAGGFPAPGASGASGASGLLTAFNAAATAVQSAERSAEQPEALGADATAAAAPATTASPAQSASAARAAAPPLTASPRVVSQRSDSETVDEPAITEPAVRLPRRAQVPDSSQELVQKLTEIELWLGEISHTLKENRGSAEDGTYRGMHALADELVRLIRNSADREFSRRGWY